MEDVPTEDYSLSRLLVKYFLHGIAFSALLLVLGLLWGMLLLVLVVVGSLIGLAIGLVLLVFLVGGLNAFLSSSIWSLDVKTDWASLLGQGFVLLLLFLLAGIPSAIINLIFPSLILRAILFLPYCVIDGYIGRKVGEWWEKGEYPEESVQEYPDL